MNLPKINQDLLSQLRGLFYSKDNPIMLPNNGFIGLSSIDTPNALPPYPYRFLYIKADGYGYILDYNGVEYRIMSLDSLGNLIIDNDLTINNNLIVLGTSNFGDNIYVDGNINITGEYQINGYNLQSPVTPFLSLPGLVGLWYPGNVQRSTGNIYDYSGQGRTLTYNGNPTINYLTNGVSYADLDGAGDYWSRADETDLRITGTESWAANPGLTFGGLFYSTANPGASGAGLISKLSTSGQYNYALLNNSFLVNPLMYISGDGTNLTSVSSSITPGTGVWYFVTGRFVPSFSADIFVGISSGMTKTSNIVGIPASIFAGTSSFSVGDYSAQYHTGYYSIAFLCASALSDAIIQSLFQQTRSLYGV